jgi:hypothetical protein
MTKAWPTAHLIHTPVHASWLNQCEIYFSVVQRKVVSPNDFAHTDQIRDRLAAFEARYNPRALRSSHMQGPRHRTALRGGGQAGSGAHSPWDV